jgi:uncharacterized protein
MKKTAGWQMREAEMKESVIKQAIEYVKDVFECEYSGHDYFHAHRVFKMATRIAEHEGANVEIVQLAALLHDVDDRKLSPDTYEGQIKVRRFLTEHNVAASTIETICQIIREVSFGANTAAPTTLEGKCVQDADRLDAIGALGIAHAFAYGGHHNRPMHHPGVAPKLNMTKEEYQKSESTSINHFYEKLFSLKDCMNTAAAAEIARERDAYMHAFVVEFLREWDGEA